MGNSGSLFIVFPPLAPLHTYTEQIRADNAQKKTSSSLSFFMSVVYKI